MLSDSQFSTWNELESSPLLVDRLSVGASIAPWIVLQQTSGQYHLRRLAKTEREPNI